MINTKKLKRNKINNTSSLFSSEEIERVIGMNRSPLELNINKITITSINNIINTVNGTQREKRDKQ